MSFSTDSLREALAGRYTLDREIGRGGMAVVFRAWDTRHERWVALKVLRPELSSSLGGERFLREIRVAAGLQHPHIVPVFDSGEAGGALFYVMPFVEGESLRGRVAREGALPVDDALRIARQVADALHYAHRRDIVHRDIKPENILLSGGHALVADFGLARAITAAGGLKLTEAGLAVGTPVYMSPEQAVGDERVDARSDVYSLGCVLFELLAGRPPYEGVTAASIMAKHSTATVPSVREDREVVPEQVDTAIQRALAKNPADRFTSAEAFAGALPTETDLHPVRHRPRVSRMALVGGLVGGLVVLAGAAWLGASAWANARNAHISIAVAPIRVSDTADASFADGLTQELTTALTRIERISPRPYATVAIEAMKEPNPLQLGRKLNVDYILAAALRRIGNQLRMTTELIRVDDGTNVWSPRSFQGSDVDLFRMQDSISMQLVRELAGNLVASEVTHIREPDPDAYKLYLQARAIPLISAAGSEKAVQMFSEVIRRDSSFAGAWSGLAKALGNRLQYGGQSPVEVIPRIEQAANRALALDSTEAEAWQTLAGMAWYLRWDFAAADRQLRKALELRPSDGWGHIEYAKFLHQVGGADSAFAEVQRALELDPTNSHFVMIAAYMLQTEGRYHEADSIAAHAITLDPENWVAYVMKGKIALKTGRNADAIRACQTYERMQGDENPFTLGQAGYCYGKAGDAASARRILTHLTELGRRRFIERAALVWSRLGVNDKEGALQELELAANARELDFLLLMRESAQDLWNEPRYQALLRRTKLDAIWKKPPVS